MTKKLPAKDHEDRLLAYVRERGDKLSANRKMLKRGWATLEGFDWDWKGHDNKRHRGFTKGDHHSYQPFSRYDEFVRSAKRAWKNDRGIYRLCDDHDNKHYKIK